MLSVIIPCYNQGKFLNDCLSSIAKSSYQPIQVIIINDGSTDLNTVEVLKTITSKFTDLDITVKHQQNGGLSNARNEGLKIASGKYIQFLDCDDMISPEKFSTQIHLFEKYSNKKCIYNVVARIPFSAQWIL